MRGVRNVISDKGPNQYFPLLGRVNSFQHRKTAGDKGFDVVEYQVAINLQSSIFNIGRARIRCWVAHMRSEGFLYLSKIGAH